MVIIMHKNNEGKLCCISFMYSGGLPSTDTSVLYQMLLPLSWRFPWKYQARIKKEKGCNLKLHKRVNLNTES